MADAIEQARQELAFLKGLVEDSRPVLRPVGVLIGLGGVIHAVSALRFWAIAERWLEWPAVLRPWLGLDALLLQLAAMILLAKIAPSLMNFPNRSNGPAARGVRAAVAALAWTLGTAGLALWLASGRLETREPLATGLPVVLFAFTSATWQIIFAIYRERWAAWAAVASALSAIAVGLSAGTPVYALVIAVGLVASLVMPALPMVRLADEE